MKAAVGDRIVVVGNKMDLPVRDGRVVELRHSDGSPPYVVEWSDSGQQRLFFPGPDAHVEHAEAALGAGGGEPGALPRGKTWTVQVHILEQGPDTDARAVLVAEAPEGLEARGHARRNAADRDVPEIGDEVAVGRALRRLADRLLDTAAADISAIEGHAVTLQR